MWAAVRQLHDEGTTVLLVTHEMDEAEALCGQVVVMRAGRVVDAGAPADLVDRHARTATIRFSLPDPPAPLLDELRRLDGVHGGGAGRGAGDRARQPADHRARRRRAGAVGQRCPAT